MRKQDPSKYPFSFLQHRISYEYNNDTLDELRDTLTEVISKMERDYERPWTDKLDVRKAMENWEWER